MSDYVTSIMRTLVQGILGTVFAHFAVGAFAVPAGVQGQVENWATSAAVAGLVVGWTAIVRAFEERQGTSRFDTYCRLVGRLLMLGVKTTPNYPVPPVPEPVVGPLPTGADLGQ